MTSKRRRFQLRTRVLAGVLAITLVAFAAFDIAAITVLRRYLVDRTDSTLHTVLDVAQPRLDRLLRDVGTGRSPSLLREGLGSYDYLAFVPDHGKTVVLDANPTVSPRLPSNLTAVGPGGHTATVDNARGNDQLRLRAVRADGGTLVAGVSLHNVEVTVRQLRNILIVGSIAAIALIALGVLLVVRRGLRPLETMATQADRITAGDLTDRVDVHDGTSEVGRLGVALNGMLGRIETSVQEQEANQELMRHFFADASHELRTPLATIRANAELYEQGALTDQGEVDETMRRIRMEATRMSKLVNDMLRLARIGQHPQQRRDRVDLTAVATECFERAQFADPRRTWKSNIAPNLVTIGDEELIRRAIDNLVANVYEHTGIGTTGTILAARRGESVVIKVSDDGPGLPADQLPHIFERFYRGGTQSSPRGSGLGLAIVEQTATMHGGSVEAALNAPHGLQITITLPAWRE